MAAPVAGGGAFPVPKFPPTSATNPVHGSLWIDRIHQHTLTQVHDFCLTTTLTPQLPLWPSPMPPNSRYHHPWAILIPCRNLWNPKTQLHMAFKTFARSLSRRIPLPQFLLTVMVLHRCCPSPSTNPLAALTSITSQQPWTHDFFNLHLWPLSTSLDPPTATLLAFVDGASLPTQDQKSVILHFLEEFGA